MGDGWTLGTSDAGSEFDTKDNIHYLIINWDTIKNK